MSWTFQDEHNVKLESGFEMTNAYVFPKAILLKICVFGVGFFNVHKIKRFPKTDAGRRIKREFMKMWVLVHFSCAIV